jgi:hypothetical protein
MQTPYHWAAAYIAVAALVLLAGWLAPPPKATATVSEGHEAEPA